VRVGAWSFPGKRNHVDPAYPQAMPN